MFVTAIGGYGLWPGWGADPQGIKPAVCVFVFCVDMSAITSIHTSGEGLKKHAKIACQDAKLDSVTSCR